MSQNFPTDAGVLITPGAYPRYNVVQQNNGVATTGIVMLVGEADAGPDFTQELSPDLAANIYGPGQIGDVKAKYKSGRLVDAFNSGAVPANDSQIQGAPAGFILVKTNPSTKATASIAHWDDSAYANVQDRSWGKLGNLISYDINAKTNEAVPTTGPFAWMLPIDATEIDFRVNGGALQTYESGALDTPTAFVAAVNGLTGVKALGGDDKGVLGSVVGTLHLVVVAGNKVTLTYSQSYAGTAPAAGDTLYIPASSPVATQHSANAGSYLVTGASAASISATKFLDVTGSHNSLTPPVSGTAQAVADTGDAQVFGAVTIRLPNFDDDSVAPVDGLGKSLEISCPNTANLTDVGVLANGTKVTFFSTNASPKIIVSATEYIAKLTESRQVDNITNDVAAGGGIALKLGYEGTTAVATVDATSITIVTVGGASAGTIERDLADYPTLADLAANLNSIPGFTAAPGTAVIGSSPSTSLDQGVFHIASTFGGTPGRIKQDAYKFFISMRDQAVLTQLDKQASSGLPAPTAGVSFLSGGAKGSTSDAQIAAALDALKLVRGNFVVPLFSRDAADDIADGQTDTSSSYTIEAVNANTLAHVLQMSTLKKRRNRQAFLSLRGTLEAAKQMSGELASFRCSLAFQDVRDVSIAGSVAQFQPWMNAVKAAGMQAAGFYRAIFNKGINISGALQAAGDFNDQDDDAVELALEAGLLIVARPPTGGFRYVSDQTTYGRDNNFVYNSIQAVYVADIISLTTAQVMEQMFVGQSLADISAPQALSVLDSIMENLKRLKLIAFSDDAPKGYKNPIIKISGPAMVVSAEVKAATALYFIPITFSITQIQQSA